MIVIGYRPGAPGRDGRSPSGAIAVLRVPEGCPGGEPRLLGGASWQSAPCPSVDAGMVWLVEQLDGEAPDAAGIAGPLAWETGEGSTRRGDRWVGRQRYVHRAPKGLNASLGVAVVQSMAFAMRLRARWPGTLINETSPEVMVAGLARVPGWRESELCRRVEGWRRLNDCPGPRCDALVSAWWTARAMLSEELPPDLFVLSPKQLMPAGPVARWWPREAEAWLRN